MNSIIVKNQIEGIHCYPNAPQEVAFLRQPHRHIFHIESTIEVEHNDRELEFIMVKHKLQPFLEDMIQRGHWQITQRHNNERFYDGTFSCEDIAWAVKRWIQDCFPWYDESGNRKQYPRRVSVKVFEDGECGVIVE